MVGFSVGVARRSRSVPQERHRLSINLVIIPVRIEIAFHQTPVPQAMFVLRDALKRMTFARQGGEGDDFGGEKGAGRIK
ncbi:MAG: hypothetical protein ACYTXF_09200 [Nostoc sp.]